MPEDPRHSDLGSRRAQADPGERRFRQPKAERRIADVSLHHTLIAHSSRSNRSDDWRIGIGITYIPTRAPHIGPTRLSAILARGTDRFNHFDHEAAPRPNSMIRACRACQLTVPLSESGVGGGDAPYSLTVKQGSVFPFSG